MTNRKKLNQMAMTLVTCGFSLFALVTHADDARPENFASSACAIASPYKAPLSEKARNLIDTVCLNPESLKDLHATLKDVEKSLSDRADLVCKRGRDASEEECIGISKADIQLSLTIYNLSTATFFSAADQQK